jgi:hypothetical protein
MNTPLHRQLHKAYTTLLIAYLSYLHIYLQVMGKEHHSSQEALLHSIDPVRKMGKQLRLLLPLSQKLTASHIPARLQKKNTGEKK